MSSQSRLRLATLLLPPLGLILLWRQKCAGLGRKILGTFGIALYSLLYLAGVVVVLMQFTPLEIEWRGGFPPVLRACLKKSDTRIMAG